MSPIVIGFIGLIACFVLIFLETPIGIAFGVVAFIGIWLMGGWDSALYSLATIPFKSISMYVWTVVPMFILMGYFALHTRMAEEFYAGVRRWIGHFRGGLASAVIIGNTGFGACTGDAVGAAITFTAISLPEMRKYHYDDKLTLGSVASASLLAGFIPPSLGFIVYGAITETSIGQLFISGIFPGLILAGLYIGVIYFQCRLNPLLGPPGPRYSWKERWFAGTGMWSLIIVFLVIIGGIYLGIFTPTEAGAFGTFTVLIIGLLRRRISWQGVKAIAMQAGMTIGMIGIILIGILMFNTFLAVTGVPQVIASFVAGVTESPTGTMWIIIAILIVLGMFIDSLALLLLMVPIFYPLAVNLGFDSIHFGMIIHTVLAMGSLTPPFGIVIYAISGVTKDVPIYDMFRGAAPFLVAIIILQALVLYIPAISLFLPSTMFGV